MKNLSLLVIMPLLFLAGCGGSNDNSDRRLGPELNPQPESPNSLRSRSGAVYNYDVLFTNPTCERYDYEAPVETQDGSFVMHKPENVFCTNSDAAPTARRDGSDTRIGMNESPKHRLMNLINSPETNELYMTYLSFSDSEVFEGLCKRLGQGNLKLTLVLDGTGEQRDIDGDLRKYLKEGESLKDDVVRARVTKEFEADKNELRAQIIEYSNMRTRTAEQEDAFAQVKKTYERMLTKAQYLGSIFCSPSIQAETQDYTSKMIDKQKGIGWSHTKLFMVNENDSEKVMISFSSANMSSGTTTHHENWHFITVSPKTYFAQVHSCLKDAELGHSDSRNEFKAFIKKCRSEISISEEDDIKVFFTPGEGEAAMETFINDIKDSTQVSMAAHRFTLKPLTRALSEARTNGTKVRMIFDDDMYLAGERRLGPLRRVLNMPMEYRNVLAILGEEPSSKLENRSAEARYMETNHFSYSLHHNKFLILDNAKRENGRPAVFCGAGNFTKAAFSLKSSATNLENYYYITIPEVVRSFQNQYNYMWNHLATPYGKMPLKDTKPIL